MNNPSRQSLVLALILVSLVMTPIVRAQQTSRNFNDPWGPRYQRVPVSPTPAKRQPPRDAAGRIRHWNEVAINASGFDHTLVVPEQLGPTRASRAMAIVHIAVFEAVNAFRPQYQSYVKMHPPLAGASMEAAIAQAAHDTLVALFPSQKVSCDGYLLADLNAIPDRRAVAYGCALGQEAAAAILALREHDGSRQPDPTVGVDFFTSNAPGRWRIDPISGRSIALGAHWGEVEPFVLRSSSQFRAKRPPRLDSAEYAAAFEEVKSLGGDGIHTPTKRTDEQTVTGIYWAYDGTPSLCAPPRLYNQITMHIADQMGTSADPVALARLLALTNVAMADACISVWESKYYYQYWRPVTGIREADPGIADGRSWPDDGNPCTTSDLTFTPLGAPASNLQGPNFTPPFPSYPSGHGAFGGALFQTLRNFYGTDRIAFTFVSDEFNGVTHDNLWNVRPRLPRNFSSLSQAEEENGQSRIYLGIHWKFDKTEAILQGRRVADYVFSNAFAPLRKKKLCPE